MRSQADGSTTIRKEKATGKVGFIRAGRGGHLMPGNSGGATAKSDAYLDEFAPAFGAPRGQPVRASVTKGVSGSTVHSVQEYKGVPFFGSLARAHVDADGDLTSHNVDNAPAPKPPIPPTPIN